MHPQKLISFVLEKLLRIFLELLLVISLRDQTDVNRLFANCNILYPLVLVVGGLSAAV